ncbi:hypothetical protein [Tardiphaga sp. 11_C7_N12_6]|uniref:hypothetical protein n=1 Tax=Tardiphaga sp. 11_C7_N12_6 TaxID=3240789 RepID=UPI003F21C78B
MSTPDRIVGGNVRTWATAQACQNFRLSVTRAKARTIILSLKDDVCVLLRVEDTEKRDFEDRWRRRGSTLGRHVVGATIALTSIHLVIDRWTKLQANFSRNSRWPQGKRGAHRVFSPLLGITRLLESTNEAAGMFRL